MREMDMDTPSASARPAVRYAATILAGDSNDPRIQGLTWVRPGSSVLEIGCGHGAVTRLLHEQLGCTVVAVDTNPQCAPSVSAYASRFVCGDIDSPDVRAQIRGDYDFVLLMDVLEHLPWPDRTLAALTHLIGEHARLVITLPNVTVWHVRLPLLRGHFQYRDTGTLDRTHLRFFDLEGAQSLLRDAGLALHELRFAWNIPGLGHAWSYSRIAEDPDTERKALRRYPQHAHVIPLAIQAQRTLNRLGWPGLIDRAAQVVRKAAPALWTNHVVMLAGAPRER